MRFKYWLLETGDLNAFGIGDGDTANRSQKFPLKDELDEPGLNMRRKVDPRLRKGPPKLVRKDENVIRPHQHGFNSLLNSLSKLGFQLHHSGFYRKETSYYGTIEIYGDKQQGNIPSKDSEYLVIQVGCFRSRLDDSSQRALMEIEYTDNRGDIKKIRDGFIPHKEFENGPEIKIEHETVNFQWWTRNPNSAFRIIDHVIDKPPQYIGGKFDNGENDYFPNFDPQPSNYQFSPALS